MNQNEIIVIINIMVDMVDHDLEEDDSVEDQGSGGVDAESNNNFTHARYHLFLHWQPEDRMGLTVLDRWLASTFYIGEVEPNDHLI